MLLCFHGLRDAVRNHIDNVCVAKFVGNLRKSPPIYGGDAQVCAQVSESSHALSLTIARCHVRRRGAMRCGRVQVAAMRRERLNRAWTVVAGSRRVERCGRMDDMRCEIEVEIEIDPGWREDWPAD